MYMKTIIKKYILNLMKEKNALLNRILIVFCKMENVSKLLKNVCKINGIIKINNFLTVNFIYGRYLQIN